jgi:hypothetical protein
VDGSVLMLAVIHLHGWDWVLFVLLLFSMFMLGAAFERRR